MPPCSSRRLSRQLHPRRRSLRALFFFNDTATTEIYTCDYTLSLHDALPISELRPGVGLDVRFHPVPVIPVVADIRSEEHTSELQSQSHISYAVFCLKKKIQKRKVERTAVARVREQSTLSKRSNRLRFFVLFAWRSNRSTRETTLFPYTTLFRSRWSPT